MLQFHAPSSRRASGWLPVPAGQRPLRSRRLEGRARAAAERAVPSGPARLGALGNRAHDSGSALPSAIRGPLEGRLGHDFSEVRVHHDQESARLAGSLGARGVTVGRDVYLGRDQWRPESGEGQRLLAHELAHAAQQGHAARLAGSGSALGSIASGTPQLDDDEERGILSNWRFRFGVSPMQTPRLTGPEADVFTQYEDLPLPGFLFGTGPGVQWERGDWSFGAITGMGGMDPWKFYGLGDVGNLLNFGSPGTPGPSGTTPTPWPLIQGQPFPPPWWRPTVPGVTPGPTEGEGEAEGVGPGATTEAPGLTFPSVSFADYRSVTIDRFAFDVSAMPAHGGDQLDGIALRIQTERPVLVWIEGHTDLIGREGYNQGLSERRAESVREGLVERGVDASILRPSGSGERSPEVLEASRREDHARNRRVVISWFSRLARPRAFGLTP